MSVDGETATLSDGTRVRCERGAQGPVTLMVRPESLHVGPVGDAPTGAVRGRAVQSSFLGTRVRVAVETAVSPVPLMIAMHGEDQSSVPAEDAEIAVWWAPEDAIVLEGPSSTE